MRVEIASCGSNPMKTIEVQGYEPCPGRNWEHATASVKKGESVDVMEFDLEWFIFARCPGEGHILAQLPGAWMKKTEAKVPADGRPRMVHLADAQQCVEDGTHIDCTFAFIPDVDEPVICG